LGGVLVWGGCGGGGVWGGVVGGGGGWLGGGTRLSCLGKSLTLLSLFLCFRAPEKFFFSKVSFLETTFFFFYTDGVLLRLSSTPSVLFGLFVPPPPRSVGFSVQAIPVLNLWRDPPESGSSLRCCLIAMLLLTFSSGRGTSSNQIPASPSPFANKRYFAGLALMLFSTTPPSLRASPSILADLLRRVGI